MDHHYVSLYATRWNGHVYLKRIRFTEATDIPTFHNEIQHIKDVMSNIVNDGGDELPETIFVPRLIQWCTYCHIVCNTWGHERIPVDIRVRINEAEERLEMPVTDFGEDEGAFYLGEE